MKDSELNQIRKTEIKKRKSNRRGRENIKVEKNEIKFFKILKIKQNKEFSFSLEPKYKRSIIDDKKSKDKDKTLFRLSKKVVNIQMNSEVKKKEIHVIKAFKYLKQRQVIELELEIKPEEKKEEGIKEKEISKDEIGI